MKTIYLTFLFLVPVVVFSQKINVSDGNTDFSIGISGSKPSLQVSIPFGDLEVVEKMLKKELKDFNGKLDDKKNEYFVSLGEIKDLGKKQFDVYAKIIGSKDSPISVCWAVDLGGAYMDKSTHSEQYSVFKKRLEKFAEAAAEASIDKQIELEKEILKELEKDKDKLIKEQEDLKADIEDLKKKITEKESDIQKAKGKEDTKKTEISAQENKLKSVEKRKEQIKN
jgi:exonuclease SbcC